VSPTASVSRVVRYWKRNGRYWTAAKAANAVLARLARRLRLSYIPAGPVVAKIEATNICNGTCRLCPVGRKEPGHRPYGRMSWEMFRRLVDELKGTVVTLDVTNWGESLLHPQILPMIRYAHDARMYTYLSTNLHTVRDEHIAGLPATGLDELALSLHGLSPATYAAYQPGYDFEAARETIARFAAARHRHRRRNSMKIKLNFVVTAVNEHEADDLPAFAARYGVEYVLSEPSLNLRFKVSPRMAARRTPEAGEIIRREVDAWLPRRGRHDRPIYRDVLDDPAAMYSPVKRVPCDWPWEKLVINHDGGASICCGGYNPRQDVGHYAGQPIRQLWNSRPYRLCRRSFRGGGRAGLRVLCGRCPGVLL